MATALTHIIFDDGLTTVEPVLVTKTLEDPFRRMTLFAGNRTIFFQNTVDDRRERIQLRTLRWSASSPFPATRQTAGPPGADSIPRNGTPIEHVDTDPRNTSPAFHPRKG
jgi:hypothetical protein